MKALATIMGIIVPIAVFAAGGHGDDSGIFFWVFLGFCAKLFVSQVVTAVLLMAGMSKATASAVKKEMVASIK